MTAILHIATLNTVGGHETALCELVESRYIPFGIENYIYALSNKVHPLLKKRLRSNHTPISVSRSIFRINIPLFLSKAKFELIKKHICPSLIIFWNCIGSIKHKYSWLYESNIPYIHYEHGNINSITFEQNKLDYLNSAQLIVANSYATSRHIALRFTPSSPIRVLLNALSANFEKQYAHTKSFPLDRPFRIGVCGRLVAVKGFAIAIYAIKVLKERGHILELHIAGTGPEKNNLSELSSRLGLRDQITFHGLINPEDINLFYKNIDVLIVPSIRETFGKACIEAQYMGCPVLVSRIEGLPETIVEGKTGYSIAPTLDLDEYAEIGGSKKDLPKTVYNPENDALMPSKALNPQHLAEKLMFIMQNPELYEKLSQNAHNTAKERFSHENHIKELWELFEEAMKSSRHHP